MVAQVILRSIGLAVTSLILAMIPGTLEIEGMMTLTEKENGIVSAIFPIAIGENEILETTGTLGILRKIIVTSIVVLLSSVRERVCPLLRLTVVLILGTNLWLSIGVPVLLLPPLCLLPILLSLVLVLTSFLTLLLIHLSQLTIAGCQLLLLPHNLTLGCLHPVV